MIFTVLAPFVAIVKPHVALKAKFRKIVYTHLTESLVIAPI
jgi:hypothetical protein